MEYGPARGDASPLPQPISHHIPDMSLPAPVKVAVTGAAGNVGYALVFRIAAGEMLGAGQPVELSLLEIPPVMRQAEGVAMELEDCAFPLLAGLNVTDAAEEGFDGVQHALLVGSRPRGAGESRADLIGSNLPIFRSQGQALNARAAADVRVTVVGNPANLNALIAHRHAPDIPASRFTALTRLDHNRAVSLVARTAGVRTDQVADVAIWGNHSATQYPCLTHATIDGHRDWPLFSDQAWIEGHFTPRIQNRGADVIEFRGASSAASAAVAVTDHVRDWHLGTGGSRTTSMAIMGEGQYDTPPGVVFSFPVRVRDGDIEVVSGLELTGFDRRCLDITGEDLLELSRTADALLG